MLLLTVKFTRFFFFNVPRESTSENDHLQCDEAGQDSPLAGEQMQQIVEPEQKRRAPRMVDLQLVKQALSDVLDNFYHDQQRQDEIGCFARSVECTLRQLDRKAFLQAKSQILKLLTVFEAETYSSSKELSNSERSKTSKGGPGAVTARGADLTNSVSKSSAVKQGGPERIIFSSKSNKSPMLTSSEQGSEFYRNFVSSILKPAPSQESSAEQACSAEGSSAAGAGGSNTPTQPLVSSTAGSEIDSPKTSLVGSTSNKSHSFMSLPSSSKPTHSPSSSSTSSPSVPTTQSAILAKAAGGDPGFHRLRSQILVDSLHVRRRPDPASPSPSTPLLRHAWNRRQAGEKVEPDPAVPGEGGPASPPPQSPPHYSGEALKVLAKNLRVTIINRQAKGTQDSSSGEDTSSGDDSEDEESSDEEDEAGEAEGINDTVDQVDNGGKLSVP